MCEEPLSLRPTSLRPLRCPGPRAWLVLAVALAAVAAPSAQAVVLVGVQANGQMVDTQFHLPDRLSVDVQFSSPATVLLSYRLESADIASGSVAFNAILSQVSASAFDTLSLSLGGGARFLAPGSVATLNQAATATWLLSADSSSARIDLLPASPEVYIGDPLLIGATDWQVGFGGLQAGEGFTLAVSAVPEPAEWMLLGCGLLVLAGWQARHRRIGRSPDAGRADRPTVAAGRPCVPTDRS